MEEDNSRVKTTASLRAHGSGFLHGHVSSLESLIAVAVGIFVDGHFAGEGAVDVGEVARGENHAEDPPDEANFQAIVTGLGVGYGQ